MKLNVAGRVFEFLKENVKMDMKQTARQEEAGVAFNEDEKVYEIRNRLKKGDS